MRNELTLRFDVTGIAVQQSNISPSRHVCDWRRATSTLDLSTEYQELQTCPIQSPVAMTNLVSVSWYKSPHLPVLAII